MPDPRYQIFITQDGSPTLVWPGDGGVCEKMHHSNGALSESLYIYHECLREALTRHWPIRILSLGLGLAYNELITVAALHQASVRDWKIWSFEADEFLRAGFREWLNGAENSLAPAYSAVLAGVAKNQQMEPALLRDLTRVALSDGRLELRGSFPEDGEDVGKCSCVYYDAFSKKMNPELWLEDTLYSNLNSRLAPACVLATYARTGVLNRALKRLGFRLLEKRGFSGKRESTLAIREEFG